MNQTIKEQINKYIDDHAEELLDFLKILVETESYSHDRDGVIQISELVINKLKEKKIDCKVIENDNYGHHIVAKMEGSKNGKILLMGHQDTAHPNGILEDFPYSNDGQFLRGPGISDMKSGLVSMVAATCALKEFAKNDIPNLELLFTPDEEIGSPISRKIIQDLAKDAIGVFNLEPARPDGSIVTARKGSAHLRLEIEGISAHSGAFYSDGISANDELAQKMIAIKELMDSESDLTINFGKIGGGVSNNIVAAKAYATIHLAFWKKDHFYEIYDKIKGIVETSYVPGTSSKLTGSIGIYPMEENSGVLAMRDLVMETAKEMEIQLTSTSTKGASDAGFTTSLGIPTICAMGPIGGNWHTTREYMELDSFIPRTKLLAQSILRLANK